MERPSFVVYTNALAYLDRHGIAHDPPVSKDEFLNALANSRAGVNKFVVRGRLPAPDARGNRDIVVVIVDPEAHQKLVAPVAEAIATAVAPTPEAELVVIASEDMFNDAAAEKMAAAGGFWYRSRVFHRVVPECAGAFPHRVATAEEVRGYLGEHDNSELPKILDSDPAAIWARARCGPPGAPTVVRIDRPTETAVASVAYRVVIPG